MSIDALLREALNDAIDAPAVDAHAVATRILERLGEAGGGGDGGLGGGGEPSEGGSGAASSGGAGAAGVGACGPLAGWSGTAALTALAVVAGAVTGIAIAGRGDDVAPTSEVLRAVPVYACPGEQEAGMLHRGDRVYVVGQSDGYFGVRNVRGDGAVVFVDAQYIAVDADTAGLTAMDCDTRVEVITLDPTPTPSPEPSAAPSRSPQPKETAEPAPAPNPGPAPAPAPPPPPPPPPPDTQAPQISNGASGASLVYVTPCASSPTSISLSAFATDNVGVTQVRATWTLQGQSKSATLSPQGGGNYSGTFGPFAMSSIDPGASENVSVTITARDAARNTSSTQLTPIQVWECIS